MTAAPRHGDCPFVKKTPGICVAERGEIMAEKKQDRKEPLAGMRPGGPNQLDRGYTPGVNAVGPGAAESANDLGGGGTGGDIDRPDVTGRGTTDDLVRHGDPGTGTPNTAEAGPRERTFDQGT